LNESDNLPRPGLPGRGVRHNQWVAETLNAPHKAPAQTYSERPAAAQLRRLLSCAWVQRVAPDADPYEHHTVPNAAVELSWEPGSLPRVVGPQSGPLAQVNPPGSTVVGVRFRPGAAPSVLGVPASELVDLFVDAEELWGEAGVRLAEQLARCDTAEVAASMLERTVLARARAGAGPDPLVMEAVSRLLPGGATEVASLSSSLFISERQLRRRSLAAVGFAPKAIHRMLRFQRFLALAHARGLAEADVAELAADTGYADQPHLTRESLRLSGRAPRALLDQADKNCRGLHDHSPSYVPLLRSRELPQAA
jgi:AraC-like DNA-binding protein